MWLPTPVYERIPLFLFLVGLLLISTGMYIGFDYYLTSFYLGVGVGCTIWGLCLFALRRRTRKILNQQEESTDDPIPGNGNAT